MHHPTYLRDAYRRQLRTRVLACRAQGDGTVAITEDTLVFPGGGGQPPDRATLGGQQVLSVSPDGDRGWVHALAGPVPVGELTMELDWTRRYDHMQQHSAQHLITALAAEQLGLATVAFHLGAERSSIDLDAESIEPEVLDELDALVGAEIRGAIPIRSRWVKPDQLEDLGVRSRGLPEGHRGDVRLVEIEGLDRNTCGGTHVNNTSELQLVAFLGTERIRGGVTRLHYAAGLRALGLLSAGLARQDALTRALSCPPAEHLAAVLRMGSELKEAARERRSTRAELAELLAVMTLSGASDGLAHLHRDVDDLTLLQAVARGITTRRPQTVALLTSGEPQGSFLLVGPVEPVARLGPELISMVVGRGGGARGRFQGRAERLDLRDQALVRLRELLAESA